MSFTVEQQLQAQIVPVETINMGLVALYVQWFKEGKELAPGLQELAKAAIAFQEAYAKKDYWNSAEVQTWPLSDEEMLAKAIAAFKDGDKGPLHNGVRKEYLPRDKEEGDNVLIHLSFLNERMVLEGKIVKIIDYPLGKGYVIERHKLIEHHLHIGPRSKYAALWVAKDPTGMSGFIWH